MFLLLTHVEVIYRRVVSKMFNQSKNRGTFRLLSGSPHSLL